jgi:hypothetical protein
MCWRRRGSTACRYVALSRHRDGSVDLHYGRDDFADQGRLVRTLSRERAKDMATDYTAADPAKRQYCRAARHHLPRACRGIVRKLPEKVRGMFEGLRLPIQRPAEPVRSPEDEAREARRNVVQRHARVVVGIFESFDQGHAADPDQVKEIREARKDLNALREHASLDLETAYKKDPSLAREAAGGSFTRAMRAMQLEAEIRTDPARRADRFVEHWNRLSSQADRAYVNGDIALRKSAHNEMAGMAKSLERDPATGIPSCRAESGARHLSRHRPQARGRACLQSWHRLRAWPGSGPLACPSLLCAQIKPSNRLIIDPESCPSIGLRNIAMEALSGCQIPRLRESRSAAE